MRPPPPPASRLHSLREHGGLLAVSCGTPWPFALSFTRLEVDLASACCRAWVSVGRDAIHCSECEGFVCLPAFLAAVSEPDCWWRELEGWLEALLGEFLDPLTALVEAHGVGEELRRLRAHYEALGWP